MTSAKEDDEFERMRLVAKIERAQALVEQYEEHQAFYRAMIEDSRYQLGSLGSPRPTRPPQTGPSPAPRPCTAQTEYDEPPSSPTARPPRWSSSRCSAGAALLDLLTDQGPHELIRRVRAAESADHDGRARSRYKRHDDATAVLCLFEEDET